MINWKELEKFIAPGKVVTLVMLIDGEEVGAFSFNVDSLAFKEALEAASHLDPVKVAEKKIEPAKSTKKAEVSKQPKPTVSDNMDMPDPELMDDEEEEEDEDEDVSEEEEKGGEAIDKIFITDNKPMTREQIMIQSETMAQSGSSTKVEPQRGSVSSGPAKESETKKEPDKPAQQQMQLTDEW